MRQPYHIFRVWAFELSALFVTVGLLIAIGVVLNRYDGKEVPEWGTNLNLNALLALLSTFLRALLVLVAAQIISQRKWDWFQGAKRSMVDLQSFDAASRGAWGAIGLLPTVVRRDPVALIAALVLLVSFLVGPFVQQASRTTPCSFPARGQNASVPFAHWIPRSNGFTARLNSGDPMATDDTAIAILSSVTSPYGSENQITPNCGTGNCTFGSGADDRPLPFAHTTVGMCNRCADITQLISKGRSTRNNTLYGLPGGFNITNGPTSWEVAATQASLDLSWMGPLFTDELRSVARWAYVNATFLGLNSAKNNSLASVCSLYPCIRTYNVSVDSNELNETELKSSPMLIEYDAQAHWNWDLWMSRNAREQWKYNYTAIDPECMTSSFERNQSASQEVRPTTKLDLYDVGKTSSRWQNISRPETCIYRQHPSLVMVMSNLMRDEIFDGRCNYMPVAGHFPNVNCLNNKTTGSTGGTIPSLGFGVVLRTLYNDGDMSFSKAARYFDAIALSMTNRFRTQYGSAHKPVNGSGVPLLDTVEGTAWETRVCVSTRIEWLVLPLGLTVITALLSFWVIFSTWRQRAERPVWKDDMLPFLFYSQRFETLEKDRKEVSSTESTEDVAAAGEEIALVENEPLKRKSAVEVFDDEPLMEIDEMMKRGKNTTMRFRW